MLKPPNPDEPELTYGFSQNIKHASTHVKIELRAKGIAQRAKGAAHREKGIAHRAYRRIRKWECGMRKKRLRIAEPESVIEY